MLTPSELAELLRRTHSGTVRLLEHCRQLSHDELHRDLGDHGFGFPTVQLQLHHIIGAEQYWVSVLQGRFLPDNPLSPEEIAAADEANFPTIPHLLNYHEQVATVSLDYLAASTPESLATPAELAVWGGAIRSLVPALVFMRILTHHHHHRGQVAAMSRLLGYPPPGSPALDFPLGPVA